MRASLKRLLVLSMPLLLAGCMVGPDFVQPDANLPEKSFYGDRGPVNPDAPLPPPTDPTWWRAFRDPVLTRLAGRVANENLDLQTATIRLAQSRFQRGVAAASLLPTVNGDGKYTRELYSQNGIVSLLGGLTGGAPPKIDPINDYNVGFDASWELDLWGKVRRQVESADAQVDQAADQRRDVLVSSLAELARNYIQLRGTQTQIFIANHNINVAQDVLNLARERQEKGLQNGLDVENAAAQLEGVRAQVPAFQQQESQYINALSLLLDLPPGAVRADLGSPRTVPVTPPRVPLGVPSELARRRPDIRAAEDQLHAATADVGVAIGQFYPTVQLNGTVGFDSLDFAKLWKGASSLQYNVGPSVTLPIFAAGKLHNTLELRGEQQKEAAINYHKTVLQAWHDVVNALVAHRLEVKRRASLNAQVQHARQALDLARSRYRDGVTDFLTVLDAERTVLQAEQQQATSTMNVALDLVQLFKALGGGWETAFPDPPAGVTETTAVEPAPARL
ncbi:MAG: efflux transporter outer membrane subunit [Xanthobacteraceae bacterium]|nr:efflux transporter outer membrane subunit [Xanthobacteraceae bacterium]